jgi:hypothetical protein
MEPIGLTFKNDGELMIVHRCLNCAKISCNRIAGDDNTHVITCLLDKSGSLENETVTKMSGLGIKLLIQDDKQEVLTGLLGYDYEKYLR